MFQEPGIVTCQKRPEKFKDCQVVFGPGGDLICDLERPLLEFCDIPRNILRLPENFKRDTIPCPNGFSCKPVWKSLKNLKHNFMTDLICGERKNSICLPDNKADIAFIIETLTDNKNRSASSIRTVLQKNGGRLGESGSTTHLFYNCGVIHIDKKKYNEEEVFEMASNFGAKDCFNFESYHEIISQKGDFYKVKSEFEKKLDNFEYSGIEWRPFRYLDLSEEQSKKILEILETLEELDDVQNTYTNANLDKIKL